MPLMAFSDTKKLVIVNKNSNQVNSASQAVTAPALKPSRAKRLRNARTDAEVATENVILQKIEKERLKNEQSIIGKVLGRKSSSSSTTVLAVPAVFSGFGEKAYVSAGFGFFQYLGVENINDDDPIPFLSFGGYAQSYFLLDATFFYSKPYVDLRNQSQTFNAVHQAGGAIGLRFSPFKGKIKPYVGFSGVLLARRWDKVDVHGHALANLSSTVATKKWYQSVDVGGAGGVDVALGSRFGLNLDVRYHVNAYTETRDNLSSVSPYVQRLDRRDSLVFSTNFRFYF